MAQSPRAYPNQSVSRNIAKSEPGPETPAVKAREGKVSILDQLASRLEMDPMDLQRVLKATVFKGASNEEFAALLLVSNAYGLNPITKEIYAFPAKGGGIVPVVSIDGWIRIVNQHPNFEGLEFMDLPDAEGNLLGVECTIWRNDRKRPTKIIEYLEECKQNTDPWKKMPARMNRHKALIQCARYAFGFSGIQDQSDAEIMAGEMRSAAPLPVSGPPPKRTNVQRLAAPPEQETVVDGDRVDSDTGELTPVDGDSEELISEDDLVAAVRANKLIEGAEKVPNLIDLNAFRAGAMADVEAMPDELAILVLAAFDAAEARLKAPR